MLNLSSHSRVLLLGWCFSTAAAAAPGDHVQVGAGELVPSVEVGVEGDTNVYREVPGQGGPFVANLRVVPRLEFSYDSDDLELDLGAVYRLRTFFGVPSLNRFFDLGLNGGVALLPQSLVSVRLKDTFNIGSTAAGADTEEANADLAASSASSESGDGNIVHYVNDLGGQLAIQPGGNLSGSLGGRFAWDDYRVPVVLSDFLDTPGRYNTRLGYGPTGALTWTFLPRTAVVVGAAAQWWSWADNLVPNSTEGSLAAGSFVGLPDGRDLRFTVGLDGRVTRRLTTTLALGYSAGRYDETTVVAGDTGADASELDAVANGFDQDVKGLDGLLAVAEVTVAPREGQKVSLRYRKDWQDSWFTNYVAYNELQLLYRADLGSRTHFGGDLVYRYEAYHGEYERIDSVVNGKARLGYDISDWLQAGGHGRVSLRRSDLPEVPYNVWVFGLDLRATY